MPRGIFDNMKRNQNMKKKNYRLANLRNTWIANQIVYPCGTTFRLGEKVEHHGEVFFKCFTSFIPSEANSIGYVNKAVLQFI